MPLPRVYKVIQDSLGNVVPQVLCSVLNQGTGVLATLWQDDAGSIPLSNPMTSDATYGSFGFYVAPGHYDLTFTKPGYTFQPHLDLQVPQDDLTLGTMAQQDAHAVAITGGDVVASRIGVNTSIASDAFGTLRVGASTTIAANLNVGTDITCGRVGVNASVAADALGTLRTGAHVAVGQDLIVTGKGSIGTPTGFGSRLDMTFNRPAEQGFTIRPTADSGGGNNVSFLNAGGSLVGTIVTTASATAYNTTSDARLKHSIERLVGALGVVQLLNPVKFRWNADDSPGEGFLAHELQRHIPEAVSGLPDEVNADGSIRPQQVDHSKIVPWLTAALQEMTTQVQALTARVADLEALLTT